MNASIQTADVAFTSLNQIAVEHNIPVEETVNNYHQCLTANTTNRYTSGLVIREHEQATRLQELAQSVGLNSVLHTFGFSSIVFIPTV
ncbi:hypothetical protein I7Z51_002571 [Vibrio parahaemolyticus]|uniref:hypothetical protein n=1 Tax=Vibrio TaxID=662 RepID=UPI001A8DAAAB|nr:MULTISPECIES: hypothetical protein [Vibrio]EGQ7973646.1 hypothetical protein [Vibrio parahaemolyticus]MBO0209856.1 hypothetical protein [Vibrio sp. Vb0877]MCR9811918.1 hypothetical protein [Vibrio parahaemolyticus]